MAISDDFYNNIPSSMGIFDQNKYGKDEIVNDKGVRTPVNTAAATDGLANIAEAVITFFHVPSETDVFFKAFITNFVEDYNSDWTPETVFGRTDPIYTFRNNTRSLTLNFKVPAATISEAYENLGRVQKLSQFLYPTYENIGSANTISQSPLIRLKVMNLAAKNVGGARPGKPDNRIGTNFNPDFLDRYRSDNNPSRGLLGFISNMTINHNLENNESGVFQEKPNTVLPKLIDISMSFSVIHEASLGWTGAAERGTMSQFLTFSDPDFPYNADLKGRDLSGISPNATYDEKIQALRDKELKRQKSDQDRLNAEARYGGMFGTKGFLGIGQGRYGKDQKLMEKWEKRQGDPKYDNWRKKNSANYDYVQSAQQGYSKT
jgi:hypothetical protein